MLERVLRYINNRFEYADEPIGGKFTIKNGELALDLLDKQYFWVENSVFNDGLHQYPADDLKDETFEGKIIPLAIPQAVIELAKEIEDWCYANKDMLDSPLQSESFGGYSYTKASGGGGSDNSSGYSWQDQFASRLVHWRKLHAEWA